MVALLGGEKSRGGIFNLYCKVVFHLVLTSWLCKVPRYCCCLLLFEIPRAIFRLVWLSVWMEQDGSALGTSHCALHPLPGKVCWNGSIGTPS